MLEPVAPRSRVKHSTTELPFRTEHIFMAQLGKWKLALKVPAKNSSENCVYLIRLLHYLTYGCKQYGPRSDFVPFGPSIYL